MKRTLFPDMENMKGFVSQAKIKSDDMQIKKNLRTMNKRMRALGTNFMFDPDSLFARLPIITPVYFSNEPQTWHCVMRDLVMSLHRDMTAGHMKYINNANKRRCVCNQQAMQRLLKYLLEHSPTVGQHRIMHIETLSLQNVHVDICLYIATACLS